jgi:hypothetical protein
MVKFTIGRRAKMYGVTIEKDMGVKWAAFAGTDDNAIVDGDFAVTEDELQPVLKALLEGKIDHRRWSGRLYLKRGSKDHLPSGLSKSHGWAIAGDSLRRIRCCHE